MLRDEGELQSAEDVQRPTRGMWRRCQCFLADERIRLSRWLASFIAACLSIRLLQLRESDGPPQGAQAEGNVNTGGKESKVQDAAGANLDLSLFAATRALDVIVGELWGRRKAKRLALRKWNQVWLTVYPQDRPCG